MGSQRGSETQCGPRIGPKSNLKLSINDRSRRGTLWVPNPLNIEGVGGGTVIWGRRMEGRFLHTWIVQRKTAVYGEPGEGHCRLREVIV